MIQVVADSTLLRYLIEIEVMDVLPVLFEQIIAPPAVIHDLRWFCPPGACQSRLWPCPTV